MNRPRYDLLDGLRGVAAILILLYHIFCDAKSFFVWPSPTPEFYHSFLGVDFFFILSGFVMGYAYDKALDGTLTTSGFIKRRLIRLHPMVVLGALFGAVCFIIQGCTKWDGTEVATESVLLSTLLALFLLPSPRSLDVRGNTELFPLNGPHWSLFIEYIGSLLYVLLLHRLSTRWLRVWVACGIVSIAGFALLTNDGGIAYGWSSEPVNFMGGLLRMLYAYPMGLLMAREFGKRRPKPIRGHIFLLCSLMLTVLLAMPIIGGKDSETIYQLVCIFSLFPAIIWLGARGSVTGWRQQVVAFLGRLSYPLYAIHFPLVYLYIIYVRRSGYVYEGLSQPWLPAIITFAAAIILATLALLCYDEPMRKWLSRKTKRDELPN